MKLPTGFLLLGDLYILLLKILVRLLLPGVWRGGGLCDDGRHASGTRRERRGDHREERQEGEQCHYKVNNAILK